ncbi:hypothetical protein PLICRDRAFT_181852 [Plicaturopsis crispa FD-325 SS-3]|nr:hypothetical protein PLICRDRAFT_181852 [Plicaturopsis crispa FD-325 SS-3]
MAPCTTPKIPRNPRWPSSRSQGSAHPSPAPRRHTRGASSLSSASSTSMDRYTVWRLARSNSASFRTSLLKTRPNHARKRTPGRLGGRGASAPHRALWWTGMPAFPALSACLCQLLISAGEEARGRTVIPAAVEADEDTHVESHRARCPSC